MNFYHGLPLTSTNSSTSSEHTFIDNAVNLSCGCGTIACCCCGTDQPSRYTPNNIQNEFDRLTNEHSLKKGQMPLAKVCLEERKFSHPSPALRYAKISRRKVSSALEPISFVLPIQYDDQSTHWKKSSIKEYCEWPFTGRSEYMRSYPPYNLNELGLHRGTLFKEHYFPMKAIEPMARFTTYSKAYQDPRYFSEEKNYDSNSKHSNKC